MYINIYIKKIHHNIDINIELFIKLNIIQLYVLIFVYCIILYICLLSIV